MRVVRKWFFRVLKIYAVVIIVVFVFGLATLIIPALERLERRIYPANFAVLVEGRYYSNSEEFLAAIPESEKQFSSRQPVAFEDIEVWAIILENSTDTEGINFASRLGVSVQEIASWDNESDTRMATNSVSIIMRWGIFPVYVQKKRVVVLNQEGLFQTYRGECNDRILYNALINLNDREFLESCKITPAE